MVRMFEAHKKYEEDYKQRIPNEFLFKLKDNRDYAN